MRKKNVHSISMERMMKYLTTKRNSNNRVHATLLNGIYDVNR